MKYLVGMVLALILILAGQALAQAPWVGCKFLTAGSGITIVCPDTAGFGGATITATGGGNVGSIVESR